MIDGLQPTPAQTPPDQMPPANAANPEPPADATPSDTTATSPEPAPTTTRAKPWLRRHWKILTAIAVVAVVTAGGALAWMLMRPKPEPQTSALSSPKTSATPVPTPVTKASPLTGLPVSLDLAARPIVSVMVENHPDARPQSGLQEAGVVYEALAEGGITRFQTFFLDGRPAAIGPVRSLRPYYIDWGLEYDAPVAHAGGSADAANLAASTHMKDLNALVIGAPTFYRTTNRAAPHNLYTSSSLLDTLLAKRGYTGAATFTPTPRKEDTPLASATHPKIHIDYSYNGYQVDYAYDPTTNNYLRSLAGAPHTDRNTGKQIQVKNVVVEYTPVVALNDDHGHVGITTVGQGSAVLFRDGDAIVCTWSKASRTARTRLLDAAGAEIPLNAGNTWYSIVPTGKTVSY